MKYLFNFINSSTNQIILKINFYLNNVEKKEEQEKIFFYFISIDDANNLFWAKREKKIN
jgi:hypothetical protein